MAAYTGQIDDALLSPAGFLAPQALDQSNVSAAVTNVTNWLQEGGNHPGGGDENADFLESDFNPASQNYNQVVAELGAFSNMTGNILKNQMSNYLSGLPASPDGGITTLQLQLGADGGASVTLADLNSFISKISLFVNNPRNYTIFLSKVEGVPDSFAK